MQIKNATNKANQIFIDRVSIRKYDPTVKIERSEILNILQDAMNAPSASNLQPWRFIVFDTDEGKDLVKSFMMPNNHQQCETASAVVAILGDRNRFSYSDQILSAEVEYGLLSEEGKKYMLGVNDMIQQYLSEEQNVNAIYLDCGLVSMQLMLSAKAYGYEVNSFGAFTNKELVSTVGLDADRYIPVLFVSIGKTTEEGSPSTRFSAEEITYWK